MKEQFTSLNGFGEFEAVPGYNTRSDQWRNRDLEHGMSSRCHRLLWLTGLALVVALAGCQTAPSALTEPVVPSQPFFDDFEGDEIDTAKWEIGTWAEHGGRTGKERTFVRDGKLHMLLVNDSEHGILNSAIQTWDTFLYGRWEARLKVSPVPGLLNSMYTIDWNGGGGTRQEIDIEFLTYTFGENRGEVHLAVHAAGMGSRSVDIELDFNPADEFRVWGFEITPEYIEWFVDDQVLHTYHYDQNPVTIDSPYQLKFNTRTQERWIRGPSEPDVVSVYQIDWIRFTPFEADNRAASQTP